MISLTANAGLFDVLKEAQDVVDTAQKAIKQIPSRDNKAKVEEKKPSIPPIPSQPQSAATSTSNSSNNSTVSNQVASSSVKNPDFINIPGKVMSLPYEQCPKVDVMGMRLGDNLSHLANQYSLNFKYTNGTRYPDSYYHPTSLGEMKFEDREIARDTLVRPGGPYHVTVYSKKFDALRHQHINKQHDYQFSDEDYNQIKGDTKTAGRHYQHVMFYTKPPKDRTSMGANDTTAEVFTDINGDIASIYVARTIPVEINVSEIQAKLTEKYGKPHQVVKNSDGKLKYQLSWTAKYVGKFPQVRGGKLERVSRSTIIYRLTCHDALRASGKKAKLMLDEVQAKIQSMRKETGVLVDI